MRNQLEKTLMKTLRLTTLTLVSMYVTRQMISDWVPTLLLAHVLSILVCICGKYLALGSPHEGVSDFLNFS